MRLKLNLYLLSCALGLCVLWGCKSQSYTPSTYPDEQLIFGRGGGFAGTVDTYYLLSDGQLFHQAPEAEQPTQYLKVTQEEVQALFAEAHRLELPSRKLNAPGNMYAFIEWRSGSQSNRLTWDPDLGEISPDLRRFYQRLMALSQPER